MKTMIQSLLIVAAFSVASRLCEAAATDATFLNFEGKQTAPVRLSPDGTRLFAVNTPDARLSVFDTSNPSNPILVAEIPVGLEPVSVNPLNNDEVWVVNEVSDSVSVVSVSRGIVTDTIQAKDEPASPLRSSCTRLGSRSSHLQQRKRNQKISATFPNKTSCSQ